MAIHVCANDSSSCQAVLGIFITGFWICSTGPLWNVRCACPLWFDVRVSIHAWVLHVFQTDRNVHVAEAGVAPPRLLMSSADFK